MAATLSQVIGAIVARRGRIEVAYGGQDVCIGAAAVAVEVLRHFGFDAFALPVSAMVEKDGQSALIGFTGQDHGDEMADIHMVVIVDGNLFDLTIDQVNQRSPAFDIGPIFADASDLPAEFAERSTLFEQQVQGHTVRYYSFPDDRSHLASSHWLDRDLRKRAVAKIIEDIEEAEKP